MREKCRSSHFQSEGGVKSLSTGGGGGLKKFRTGGITDLGGTFTWGSVPHYMPFMSKRFLKNPGGKKMKISTMLINPRLRK